MIDDDSAAGTSLPGDVREQELARKQNEKFGTIKVNSYWFLGLHGYFFVTLCFAVSGGRWIPDMPLDIGRSLVFTAVAAWPISVILALRQLEITLRNALILRWWMTALGVLPWMVIATEAVVLFLVYIQMNR